MSENSDRRNERRNPSPAESDPEIALEILRAVRDIHYGSVEVVVHDSKVVQIERKEKFRFGQDGSLKGRG